MRTWPIALLTAAAAVSFILTQGVHAQSTARHQINIPAKPIASALKDLAAQTGLQVLVFSEDAGTRHAPAVQGNLTHEEALVQLLRDSGLTYKRIDDNTVVVREEALRKTANTAPDSLRLAQSETRDAHAGHVETQEHTAPNKTEGSQSLSSEGEERVSRGIPEVLVQGSRALNMDIRRSRDDAQPYVIFDRVTIEQSAATNVEEFLKNKLTMNTQGGTNSQSVSLGGSTSSINLRGLGSAQTLILIDGRRVPSTAQFSRSTQPDVNGIPLAAIERIEVLPTTASGIYGGDATGGVVNIILRRDYVGAEIALSYENSVDTDSAIRRIDFNGGFNLEGGRTSVLLAASYSYQNPLLVKDRPELAGYDELYSRNPALVNDATTPPLGRTTNIRSVSGAGLFGSGTPSFASVPVGYAGGGGSAPLQANAGRYNLDFASSGSAGGGRRTLLTFPTQKAMIATLRREFSQKVSAFLDLAVSDNISYALTSQVSPTFTLSATAPNNPFGQAVRVTVPISEADGKYTAENVISRAVGGVIFKLMHGWTAEVDYGWSRSTYDVVAPKALNAEGIAAIMNGTVDVLRDPAVRPFNLEQYVTAEEKFLVKPRTMLKDTTLRIAGPIGSLAAGRPTLSILAEQRHEGVSESLYLSAAFGTSFILPSRSTTVDSAYVELRVPLISGRNRRLGVEELEVQIAGRYEDYTSRAATGFLFSPQDPLIRVTNRFDSFDPTVGMRFKPVQDLMVRIIENPING